MNISTLQSESDRLLERKFTYRFMIQMAIQGIIVNIILTILFKCGVTIPIFRQEIQDWLPWVVWILLVACFGVLLLASTVSANLDEKIQAQKAKIDSAEFTTK